MKKLTGSIVALVTPFHEDGSVDFARLRELCDWHIANGTDAILALGTTGETASTSLEEEMRAYASRLVAAVKASDAKYTHDNQTRKTCPDCGKFLLLVKGKRGEMLVCPDRECGYRKSVTQVTNARCPNCFKKMELRGEGENQMFACVCGYREKLSAFQERRKSAGAGKRDVAKYLQQQKDDKPVNSGMADALAKWLEKNQK